jgi:hypothetical protein
MTTVYVSVGPREGASYKVVRSDLVGKKLAFKLSHLLWYNGSEDVELKVNKGDIKYYSEWKKKSKNSGVIYVEWSGEAEISLSKEFPELTECPTSDYVLELFDGDNMLESGADYELIETFNCTVQDND